MNLEDLVTKSDLEEFKNEIISAILSMQSSGNDDRRAMTAKEAMVYLGNMARSTLSKKTSDGEIASCKTGKGVKYLKCDLDAYLLKTRRRPNDEITRLYRRRNAS